MFKIKRKRAFRQLWEQGWPLALALLLCAASGSSIATRPISRLDTPWWKQRFEAKQIELSRNRVDLLWLGDSITQDWERTGPQPSADFMPVWRRFYGDRHAVNLGFRGDSTCHLLWRLQHGELDRVNPKVGILLIGANNFGHIHTDAENTYDGIVVILDLLHRRMPKMHVLLIGVLPSIRSTWVDTNTQRLNLRLATLPTREGPWLHYTDVSATLQTHGRTDPSRFLDPLLTPPDPPLHPNSAAQADIAAMIEPLISAWMDDYRHG